MSSQPLHKQDIESPQDSLGPRPVGGYALPARPRLSLPVMEAPSRPAVAPLVFDDDLPVPRPPTGEAFSPYKILNHFDRLRAFAGGENVWPITVEIDPTNICNHRCQWCVSELAHNKEKLEADRILSLIEELKKNDVRSVVFKGGGEPTTHPQFPQILRAAAGAGLGIGLITNGSMPRAGALEAVADCADWARVSLDAARAETHQQVHGTKDFDRIIGNIRHLTQRSTRLTLGINFVCEKRNYAEMEAFGQMARDLGVAYVTIRVVFDPNSPIPADLRPKMKEAAQRTKALETDSFRVFLGNFSDAYLNGEFQGAEEGKLCLGPNLVGIVGGDGEVYACCFLRGNKDFSFGNVNEQAFADVWDSEKRQQVMRRVYRGECGKVCAGGMTANRYNTYNDILNYLMAEEKRHAQFA